MNKHSEGRAPCHGEAMPEIQINLQAMTLADLNTLQIAVAMAAAPKWRELGVELTEHRLPALTMKRGAVAVQYLTTTHHENVVCHFVVELPSLPALAEVVSQKSIYQRGYEAVRKLFNSKRD